MGTAVEGYKAGIGELANMNCRKFVIAVDNLILSNWTSDPEVVSLNHAKSEILLWS